MGCADAALIDAEEAAAECPSFVKAHYRRAQALQALRRYDLAAAVCMEALQLEPRNPQLLKLHSACLQSSCEEPACEGSRACDLGLPASCAATVSSKPPSPAASIVEPPSKKSVCHVHTDEEGAESYVLWCESTATRLASEEECGQAVAWFTHALDAAPSEATPTECVARLLADRAASLLQLGRYSDAVEDCRRAVELLPSLADAHIRGSVASLHLGKLFPLYAHSLS
ncbi:MAG: hypothetical protein SGPRY_009721 [Prymnesium sp.]